MVTTVSQLYGQLATIPSEESILSDALVVLSSASFPVTAWQSTGIARGLLQVDAKCLNDLYTQSVAIGSCGLLDQATGDWLDIIGLDRYDEPRLLASTTIGLVSVTNTSGSTWTKGASEVILTAQNGTLIYRNIAAISIANGASGTFYVIAEQGGSAYNQVGTALSWGTTEPGITLYMAADATWITGSANGVVGSDDETDPAYRLRLQAKWGILAQTGSADSYRYWATYGLTTNEINRVGVEENLNWNALTDRAVWVTVASPAGPCSPTAWASAVASVEAHRPLGVYVGVRVAIVAPLTLTGTITVGTSYQNSYQGTALSGRLTDLIDNWPLGADLPDSHILAALFGDGQGFVDADITVSDGSVSRKLTSGMSLMSPGGQYAFFASLSVTLVLV